MKFRLLASSLLWLLFSNPGFPQTPTSDLMPLEQVKPGQKGIGKTIFQGSSIETFEVDVLGVLENIAPQRDLILARLGGEKVRQTGVFAGMSGSPVYIDGRLIGAVAYSFPFSKEPIAGITPIHEMVDVFKERPGKTIRISKRRKRSLRELTPASTLEAFSFLDLPTPLTEVDLGGLGLEGKLTPIATPLSLSGLSPQALRLFAPQFQALGLVPMMASGVGRASDFGDSPLAEGTTVTVGLIRGDLDASAAGTLTMLRDNRIYAFGHPFIGSGYTDMPLNKGAVVTVISSLSSSQKLTAAGDLVGAVKQDRAAGVLAMVGEEPKLLPIEVQLRTSRNESRKYNFEVVNDTFLTPFLTTLAVFSSITSSERTIGGQTLQVRCTISIKDQPEVRFENAVSDLTNGSVFAALAAAAPVNFLLTSGFDDLQMEKVSIDITVVEQTRTAELVKVWLDKTEVKQGEEVGLTVFLRKPNGDTLAEKYPIKIPDELPPGPLNIMVGDGMTFNKVAEETDAEFVPENLSQLIRAINNLKKNDRLYIRLYRSKYGAVVGGEGLPDLPPSMLELYRSNRTAGTAKKIKTVVYIEHELPATSFVLDGRQVVKLEVKS